MQTQIGNYARADQKLSEIIEFYMEELKVDGRDYSELVIDEIKAVSRLKYTAETQIQEFYVDYVSHLYADLPNEVNSFIRVDKQSGELLGEVIIESFLLEKSEEQKEEELRSLEARCIRLSKEISDFYDAPLTCLNLRNDIYVNIYFSLRSLRNALTSPKDQSNPQDILARYRKIQSCLNNFRETMSACEGDFEIAFRDQEVIFEQEIDVMGTPHLLSYPMTGVLFSTRFGS